MKGPEQRLPSAVSFSDKDGSERREVRIKWWDPDATTFRKAAIGVDDRLAGLPDLDLPVDFIYRENKPVLFGHYWMNGEPKLTWIKTAIGRPMLRRSARPGKQRTTLDLIRENRQAIRKIARKMAAYEWDGATWKKPSTATSYLFQILCRLAGSAPSPDRIVSRCPYSLVLFNGKRGIPQV